MQKPTKFNTRSFGRVGQAASGLLGGLLFSSGFVMTLPTALTTSAVVGGAAMIGAAMYSPDVAAAVTVADGFSVTAATGGITTPGFTAGANTTGASQSLRRQSAWSSSDRSRPSPPASIRGPNRPTRCTGSRSRSSRPTEDPIPLAITGGFLH